MLLVLLFTFYLLLTKCKYTKKKRKIKMKFLLHFEYFLLTL